MIRRRTCVIVVLVSALAVVGTALAQKAEHKGRWKRSGKNREAKWATTRPAGPLEKLPDMLNMTAEQRQQYDQLRKDHQAAIEKLFKQLRDEKEQFRASFDKLLTAEQREQAKNMRERMKERRRQAPACPLGGPCPPGPKGMQRGEGGPPRDRGTSAEENILRPGLLHRAIRELELPKEKAEQVMAIAQKARESCREKIETIHREMTEQIKSVLGSDDFERLIKRARDFQSDARQRWQGRQGRGRGPGPRHQGGPPEQE